MSAMAPRRLRHGSRVRTSTRRPGRSTKHPQTETSVAILPERNVDKSTLPNAVLSSLVASGSFATGRQPGRGRCRRIAASGCGGQMHRSPARAGAIVGSLCIACSAYSSEIASGRPNWLPLPKLVAMDSACGCVALRLDSGELVTLALGDREIGSGLRLIQVGSSVAVLTQVDPQSTDRQRIVRMELTASGPKTSTILNWPIDQMPSLHSSWVIDAPALPSRR